MNVLILLDREDTGDYFRKFLQKKGHDAVWCSTATEAMSRIRQGLGDFDVVFLHKDLGEPKHEWHISAEMAAQAILEEASQVRLGIVSGEYPDGERHAERLKADFYCSYTDLMGFGLVQVEKGMVSIEDQQLRGTRVEKPSRSGGLERW